MKTQHRLCWISAGRSGEEREGKDGEAIGRGNGE